jgi:hypothetical protein
MVNGTKTSVDKFPLISLNLYKNADEKAPNRAINTLGMARSHAHLGQHAVAVSLYQQLFYQMTWSNTSDDTFLKEANEYLDQHSSAIHCNFSFYLMLFSFVCFFFHKT